LEKRKRRKELKMVKRRRMWGVEEEGTWEDRLAGEEVEEEEESARGEEEDTDSEMMEEEEDGLGEEVVVDIDLEAGRGEDNDKEKMAKTTKVMTLETCSENNSLESEPVEDRKETRKERVDWKKLKLDREIRDLLSSDDEEDKYKNERRSKQKACWGVRARMRWIKNKKSLHEGLRKS
jgi:hypothetical protein